MITPLNDISADAPGSHYDSLDGFYREVWGDHVHHGMFTTGRETVEQATEALAVRVLDSVGLMPGARAVDVGCGYGATSRLAAQRFGAHVTGLTLSAAQAHVSSAAPLQADVPRPTILVRNWLDNGLESASFDAVWAIESTTHMPSRQRVFDEVARVLRPGGRFALCVWATRDNPSPRESRWLLEPICREGRLHGMGSFAENLLWLQAAGLEVEHVEDWSGPVARTWTIVARRVAYGLLTNPAYRAFLRNATNSDRVFVLTILRLRAAFATGAMRYGFFVARRPH
jgi:tocopherol O-methyltransferase